MKRLTRRYFLKAWGALAATSLSPGCAMEPAAPSRPIGRVIVIGGGYGGAPPAKYLRMWGGGVFQRVFVSRDPPCGFLPPAQTPPGRAARPSHHPPRPREAAQ